MFLEYFNFIIALMFCLSLSFILFVISYFGMRVNREVNKISAYECGFQPYEDILNKFDVRYYLVAILFILFDLEIMFLLPWAVCFFYFDLFAFVVLLLFLLILTFGFVFEWYFGALEWD